MVCMACLPPVQGGGGSLLLLSFWIEKREMGTFVEA